MIPYGNTEKMNAMAAQVERRIDAGEEVTDALRQNVRKIATEYRERVTRMHHYPPADKEAAIKRWEFLEEYCYCGT